MSFLSKVMVLIFLLFNMYLGSIADPIKNAIKAMARVITKLVEGAFSDKIKNIANNKSTINGLNKWFFKMFILFKSPKKFSSGYNPLKKLLTHCFSINAKIENIVVNKKDLWNSSLILFITEVNFE